MSEDFWIHNHGSLCVVRPKSDEARAWIEDNVGEHTVWSGGGVVVEPRYLAPIIDGITESGMSWRWM